jgi:PTS system nitrogen regulatory IIA component
MQTEAKEYWKLFKPAACSLKLSGASKEAVFEELVENLVKAKCLDGGLRAAAVRALVQREELASTGMGQNVAIPHVKLAGLEEPVFSLSLHKEGIEWASLDGAPVTIFFAVLRPEQAGARYQPERHLEMMRWISQLGRDADFRRFALALSTKKELVDLLKEMSAS